MEWVLSKTNTIKALPILIKFGACLLQTFVTGGSGTRRSDGTLRRSYSFEVTHDVFLWNTGKNYRCRVSLCPSGTFRRLCPIEIMSRHVPCAYAEASAQAYGTFRAGIVDIKLIVSISIFPGQQWFRTKKIVTISLHLRLRFIID